MRKGNFERKELGCRIPVFFLVALGLFMYSRFAKETAATNVDGKTEVVAPKPDSNLETLTPPEGPDLTGPEGEAWGNPPSIREYFEIYKLTRLGISDDLLVEILPIADGDGSESEKVQQIKELLDAHGVVINERLVKTLRMLLLHYLSEVTQKEESLFLIEVNDGLISVFDLFRVLLLIEIAYSNDTYQFISE